MQHDQCCSEYVFGKRRDVSAYCMHTKSYGKGRVWVWGLWRVRCVVMIHWKIDTMTCFRVRGFDSFNLYDRDTVAPMQCKTEDKNIFREFRR